MAGVMGIPTSLLMQPARQAIADSQRRLAAAQAESASGRHSDVGLKLGVKTGTDIGLRVQLASIEQATSTANQASIAATTTQDALAALNKLADNFRSTLTAGRGADNGRSVASTFARTSLESLRDYLSTTYDGAYLFAGLASNSPPITAYDDGPRQAVVDAFQSTFGFPPDDPAATTLTATEVTDFINGEYSSLFSDPAWSSTWTAASVETPEFRLPSGSAIDLSVTANAPFTQVLSKALSMMEVLGNSKINATAFAAATDKALIFASDAQARISDEQARLGIGQASLREALSSLGQRKSNITKAVSAFENVDPYEAATRLNVLMAQLQASYELTSRISRMSLLSYL